MTYPTYHIHMGDCVAGMAAHLEPESVHLTVSSIPFQEHRLMIDNEHLTAIRLYLPSIARHIPEDHPADRLKIDSIQAHAEALARQIEQALTDLGDFETMEQENAHLRAQIAEAEARAKRWARYGFAYQVALQFDPEDETDDAMCAAQEVEDAWRDLTEHGDLIVLDDQVKRPGTSGDLV